MISRAKAAMPAFARVRRPDRFALAIAAFALLGAALVLYRQSAYGASLSADSVSYISMARSALAGHGFMPYHGGYVSNWPPLTSALYAAFSFGVFDPMAVAGPLNAAMFALAVFTVGMWLRRRVESPLVVAWACLSLVFAVSAVRMFDWIWSEPSFILAATLALRWTDRHLEDGKRSSLALAAAFSALACLSRYLGAALVVAVAGMILLRRGVSWRERLLSAAAYSAVSLLPICAWLARNRLNTGLLFGNRGIDELTLARVPPTLAEMANWWLPYVPIPGAEGAAVWATAAALSVAAGLALFALHRWLRADADGRAVSSVPLLAAFAAVYAASISVALMTGAVNIDRYISPMFVPLLLLAALALDRALSWTRRVRFGGRIPAFALIGALAAWTAFGGYVAVADAHARANGDGEGRTSRYFRESETVQYLLGLRGAEWNIGVGFSNEPMRAYLASDGRGIYPHRWRGRTSEAFESRYDAPDDTIIVWFHDVVPKSYGASEFFYSPGFEPLGSFQDGDVFRLKRGHPPADPRAGTLILDSHYDVYLNDGALVWVRQPCSDEDARGFVELWAEPADPDDPRADVGDSGTVSMNFIFLRYGAKIGDLCVIRRPLPDYPIRRIGTGQNVPGDKWLYRTAIPMPISDDARAHYIKKYETVAAGGVPLLSGAEYDVYLDGGELVYLKQPCGEDDARGRFLLSAFPADVADIPQERRELGHESLNFAFDEYGVIFGDRCMIRRPLPDYEIKAANVGRWLPGESGGWSERVRMPASAETRERYRAKYESVLSDGVPLLSGEYAVYLAGGELVYLKQPCADSDARGRFTLSAFPFELADIPAERRAAGYETLDFAFDDYGVIFGDMCMIRRPLPGYAVKRADIGRHVPDGESGGWQTARVALPPDAETRGRYREKYDSVASGGVPLARSEYDVYLDGGDLVYLKRPCADEHARGRFLLSVFPADLADIPEDRRELGHDSLNFDFADYGVRFGDRCMMRRPLPDYAVESVEIGRWLPGEGAAWQTRVAVGE